MHSSFYLYLSIQLDWIELNWIECVCLSAWEKLHSKRRYDIKLIERGMVSWLGSRINKSFNRWNWKIFISKIQYHHLWLISVLLKVKWFYSLMMMISSPWIQYIYMCVCLSVCLLLLLLLLLLMMVTDPKISKLFSGVKVGKIGKHIQKS